MIHRVKGFGIVNETEVDIFLDFSCFFCDSTDCGNLISGSFAFSKTSLYIWKFWVHRLLKPSLKNFPVCCDLYKGFGIVNKAEIDVFLELSCFFDGPADVGNLISGSSAFLKGLLLTKSHSPLPDPSEQPWK